MTVMLVPIVAVILMSVPSRIVSLAPSVTEILYALGAGDRIVGATVFCTYPPQARHLPRIGGLINPDLEKIVSLKPDLVIATTAGNYQEDAERIGRLGIPVYTVSTPTLESVLTTLVDVGRVLGSDEQARLLVANLSGRLDRVRRDASLRPTIRTLFVIEADPLIAPGPGTFLGEALFAAGARLVTPAGSPGWAQMDLEQVIAAAPEVILTAEPNRAWAESLASRPEWRKVPAVLTGKIFVISDSIQHPGPRLFDGIEEVAAILNSIVEAAPPRHPGSSPWPPDRRVSSSFCWPAQGGPSLRP